MVQGRHVMPTILITGSNRGLGLALVRLYGALGWIVHATCRNPAQSEDLREIAETHGDTVFVHPLDVTDHGAIDRLAEQLEGMPIDVLVSNAAIMDPDYATVPPASPVQSFGMIDYASWTKVLRVNLFGPTKLAEAMVENVARSDMKIMLFISSNVGSIGLNDWGRLYAYRTSKTALNMVVKGLSVDLRSRGIVAVAVYPGWVRTEMGGPEGKISAADSAECCRRIIAGLSPDDGGKFFSYTGDPMPW